MTEKLDLDAIEARYKIARREVSRLCLSRGRRWTMSIPIREDDTDIVLANSLRGIPALLAEVRRLRALLTQFLRLKDELEET